MSQLRAIPAIGSHVSLFFYVELKERGNILRFFQLYKRKNVCRLDSKCDTAHAPQTGWPVSSFKREKSVRSRRIPAVDNRDLGKAGEPGMHKKANWCLQSCDQISRISREGESAQESQVCVKILRVLFTSNL